jgi:hypothetical protein
MAGQVSDYSWLDRFLHRLAFASPNVQKVAADLEDSLFAKEAARGSADRPIFVTSLPRAGTTVLLTAFADLPHLASHTYRDMPFVMAPLLWSKVSRGFQKDSGLKERAHGDGIQVGFDSPEAFEEILWRAFWPGKFSETGIDLWTAADAEGEATAFFRRHMAKIVALRCPPGVTGGRYISKNNANVARLDLIPAMFPDATIVVPIRAPMEHAASLLRQHQNFLAQHAGDPFVRRYMRDIGHLEFGALHRPIAFPGMAERSAGLDPDGLDYWLAYWIAAFEYVQARRERLVLVPHEVACNDGRGTVERVVERLDLDLTDAELTQVAAHFKPEAARTGSYPAHDAVLRDEAERLYRDLSGAALRG